MAIVWGGKEDALTGTTLEQRSHQGDWTAFLYCIQEQKDQHDALPINYTIRKLLNYIEDKVSDRVDMQKANKTIMQALMKHAYVPDTDGPVKFFKLMEHDVLVWNYVSIYL
jgi:hypothetical protein